MKYFRAILFGALLAAFGWNSAIAAEQSITIGAQNAGNGDNLFNFATKVKGNFDDLYATLYAPITGDFSIPSGTNSGTINAGVITLPKFFNFPADTTLCNPASAAALPIYCTVSQMQTLLGVTIGGTTDPNTYTLCTQTGIDPTGVADSNAAVQAAFIAVAGTTKTLVVNCPVFVHTGYDNTKQVQYFSNTAITFGPKGEFIVDNINVPTFVEVHAAHVVWTNTKIHYKANYGMIAINWGVTPPGASATLISIAGPVNDGLIKNYLTGTNPGLGATYGSGISGQWPGAENMSCTFVMKGGSDIRFTGVDSRFYVDDGVAASYYAPCMFSLDQEWIPGMNIPAGTSPNQSNSVLPDNITFDHWWVDGTLMGWVGDCTHCNFTNIISNRYTDLQDGTNGTVNFNGSIGAGATSASLSSVWPYPTGMYWIGFTNPVNFSGAIASGSTGTGITLASAWTGITASYPVTIGSQTITIPLTQGSTAVGTFASAANNTCASPCTGSTLQITGMTFTNASTAVGSFSSAVRLPCPSPCTGASGNMGGIVGAQATPIGTGAYSAPPHVFYLSTAGNVFSPLFHINGFTDNGIKAGIAVERNSTSGTTASVKIDLGDGSVFENFMIRRPSGALSVITFSTASSNGTTNGTIRNGSVEFDSSIATQDGNNIFGVGFPGPQPLTGMVFHNVQITDTATVPTAGAFPGNVNTANADDEVTDVRVYQNDWPLGATWYPGGAWAGNHMRIQEEFHWPQMNSQTTNRGVFNVQTNAILSNSWIDVQIYGWHRQSVVFTANVASGSTSATLSATQYPSGWSSATGVYPVSFSTDEIKYVTLTAGAYTATWPTALLSTAGTQAYAGAAPLLQSNFGNWKNRISIGNGGYATGNYGRILDVDNNVEQVISGGLVTEYWTQEWSGTPTSTAVTFAAAPTAGATASGVLSTAWTNPTGSYQLTSSTGQLVFCALTLNSTAGCTFSAAITGSPTATFSGPFITPINFTTAFAVDRLTGGTKTTLDATQGLTTWNVGTLGVGNTAYYMGPINPGSPTYSSTPLFAPKTVANGFQNVILSPTAGAFGTTGYVQVTLRGGEIVTLQ